MDGRSLKSPVLYVLFPRFRHYFLPYLKQRNRPIPRPSPRPMPRLENRPRTRPRPTKTIYHFNDSVFNRAKEYDIPTFNQRMYLMLLVYDPKPKQLKIEYELPKTRQSL